MRFCSMLDCQMSCEQIGTFMARLNQPVLGVTKRLTANQARVAAADGQSCKHFTIVNYHSRGNFEVSMTLGS